MEKAFGYLRVSGVSQVKGDGFPRQEKAIRDYAKANNLQIQEVFKEKGVSGTKENRPALACLMVSLEQNGHGIKTVIIEKLDRLARDLMVQEAIVADFRKRGFNIISSMEGPDLCGDDPTRNLIRQVMGAVAQYDKTMLVAKLKASRERERIKHGKCEGRKGYRESEEGKALIRRIGALRRKPKAGKRRTWQQIADIFNQEGLTTMDGKPWSLFRVQQIAKPYKRKGG
ncbi:MAG: recombinase family protein [Deltaproteobacteria bacterium]|jgi:DNA invertase Pin-like site-specific DNA recombinase|nr:recombinase family protein [Deltaproteobacteria bacterium]